MLLGGTLRASLDAVTNVDVVKCNTSFLGNTPPTDWDAPSLCRSRADVFQPARMSFRLLKIGHRIELFQNPQLNGVLGSRAAGAKGIYIRAFEVVHSVVQGA